MNKEELKMSFKYKVIQESSKSALESELNSWGPSGWKCVSVVYNNEIDTYVAVLMKEC